MIGWLFDGIVFLAKTFLLLTVIWIIYVVALWIRDRWLR